MSKIICIGSATKDIFFPTNEGVVLETPEDVTAQRKLAFELGAKYHIANRHETLGGCAVNVACGLARQGETVSCYVPVGKDEIGNWIKQELTKESVQTSAVEILPDTISDLSAIIVNETSGDRVIFSSHGASQKFKIRQGFAGAAEWLFVCDLSGNWQNNLELIFAQARIKNCKIAFNPRQQMLHQDGARVVKFLADCELLFVNKDEAIEIVNNSNSQYAVKTLNDEQFLLRTLRSLGAKKVILTDGEKGAWVFDGKEMFFAQALLREALDTTGAGDAFASGFLGAELKGSTIAEALKWGIANSSNSVNYFGGVAGLMKVEEIMALATEVAIKKIDW